MALRPLVGGFRAVHRGGRARRNPRARVPAAGESHRVTAAADRGGDPIQSPATSPSAAGPASTTGPAAAPSAASYANPVTDDLRLAAPSVGTSTWLDVDQPRVFQAPSYTDEVKAKTQADLEYDSDGEFSTLFTSDFARVGYAPAGNMTVDQCLAKVELQALGQHEKVEIGRNICVVSAQGTVAWIRVTQFAEPRLYGNPTLLVRATIWSPPAPDARTPGDEPDRCRGIRSSVAARSPRHRSADHLRCVGCRARPSSTSGRAGRASASWRAMAGSRFAGMSAATPSPARSAASTPTRLLLSNATRQRRPAAPAFPAPTYARSTGREQHHRQRIGGHVHTLADRPDQRAAHRPARRPGKSGTCVEHELDAARVVGLPHRGGGEAEHLQRRAGVQSGEVGEGLRKLGRGEVFEHPTPQWPVSARPVSVSACADSERMRSAYGRSSSPARVGETPDDDRCSSGRPTVLSSLRNCWLSAGWVCPSAIAARLMLPARTAVTNDRSRAVSRSLAISIHYASPNKLATSYGVRADSSVTPGDQIPTGARRARDGAAAGRFAARPCRDHGRRDGADDVRRARPGHELRGSGRRRGGADRRGGAGRATARPHDRLGGAPAHRCCWPPS